MPAAAPLTSAADQALLIELGGRLKAARKAQGLTTTAMADQAGLSRMTLAAVEAGQPSPTMGSYIRVLRVLGRSADLALLATASTTDGQTSMPRAVASNRAHQVQDLQSLVLHQEAVRLMKMNPVLVELALATLERWREAGPSRSRELWDEWLDILNRRAWRQALAQSERGRQLRQASPIATVLPDAVRRKILADVQSLRRHGRYGTSGPTFSSAAHGAEPWRNLRKRSN